MTSEIFRKLNSKNEVIVIISIMFALNPILVNSKPIIVGKEIIKQEKIIKLYIVNFLTNSKLKYSCL